MGSSAPPLLSVSCTHLGQKRGALGGSGSLVGPGGVPWVAANLASEKRLSLGPGLGSLLTASPGLPPHVAAAPRAGGRVPSLGTEGSGTGRGAADTCAFTGRMREASARPRREYKPKAREPFDLGEPEQSNGGLPCAPTPSLTGNSREGLRGPRAWPPPTLCKRDPRGGTGRRPRALSYPPSVFCLRAASSSFRSSDKPIRTPSRSMRECPLPWHTTLPSFWKVLSHSPSPVEVGAHCGQSSQPLMSWEGAGHRAACPHPPGPRPPHAQEELL